MQQQSESAAEGQESAGALWQDADKVRGYVERNDRVAALQAEVYSVLTAMLPFEMDARIRVLDVGAGYGSIAAAVLDAFPNAEATGLDMSDAMMAVGRERMAAYGSRFRYHVGDFSGGALPADLAGPFDVVVSARAIHHLRSDGKRRFYGDIYEHLNDGGCFINLDNMRELDEVLRQRFRLARSIAGDPRGMRALGDRRPSEPRPPRPESEQTEFPDPLNDQVAWLREAGFEHADCLWKRLDFAMIGGYKGAASA